MRVTGANLLKIAGRVISKQRAELKEFVGNVTLANGIQSPQYSSRPFTAHIQPLDAADVVALGLQLNGAHIKVWGIDGLKDIERDGSSDVIVWRGEDYKIVNKKDWFGQDGWNRVYATRVLNAGQ